MNLLAHTSLLSFEITNTCNLSNKHKKCPINHREYRVEEMCLSLETIIQTIRQAQSVGFSGMVAFHYYNEPLLNKGLIEDIINSVPDAKYLLWTNGLLLNRCVEKNTFLKKFRLVCITCYDKRDLFFFESLRDYYGNIEIFNWELDDRVFIYDKTERNELCCKRPLFEIPIDYYGNIHLCCMDWNNNYIIGNIFNENFIDILNKDQYRNLIEMCKRRLLDENVCPDICKTCDKVWVSYPKYYD